MIKKTVSSGVSCRIIPKKDFIGKEAMIAVKFGSDISGFTLGDRHYTLPAGTAHFAEHKMFECPDGNAMTKMSDMGAEVNAFTTFDMTAYYFTCTENFYENLAELVKMVSKPYFIPESIDNERKIIASEIKMYEDDPWQTNYFALLKKLYGGYMGCPIAGTERDIAKIDANLLELCYDTFYTPKNIMLIAAGDLDEDRVTETAEENFNLPDDKAAEADIIPPNDGKSGRTEVEADIKMPLFGIGARCTEKTDAEDIVKMRIISDCLFGARSEFYQKLLDERLADCLPNTEYMNGRCYNALLVTGSSYSPEKVFEYAKQTLQKCDLNNIKRTVTQQYAALCMRQDNIDGTVNAVASCFAKNTDLLDIYGIYGKIVDNIENFAPILPEMSGLTLSVVCKKR